MAAAHAFHDVDEAVVHLAAPPKRLCIDSASMAAETAGYLDIVPGPKIADSYPEAALGKNNDVPVLFHFRMLEVEERDRPAALGHRWSESIEKLLSAYLRACR